MKIGTAASLFLLLAAHLLAALAGLISPYDPQEQHRNYPWQPPTQLRWQATGLFVQNNDALSPAAVHWLSVGPDGRRLFRVHEPARVFLLGTDGLGRDQFSRLLHGARISLYSGLAAAAFAAFLGFWLGGIAGYFGGWTDRAIMAFADLFFVLPWMYLLLAARAFLPLNTNPYTLFAIVLFMLGAIGWARPARIVRGIVRTEKERDYVRAARGFGAGPAYLLARHVLPPAIPAVMTFLAVAIPQYIAAEATLSFLGLGFGGSIPSWGALIANLASLEVLGSYWWMWIPALCLAAILACYSVLSTCLSALGGRNQ